MRGLCFACFVGFLPLAGCSKPKTNVPVRPPLATAKAQPPHGGTAVSLGDDYSIEFVLDAGRGTLEAYVLDDDMENFIRVQARSFDLAVDAGGAKDILTLTAGGDQATGESVGNTSYFQVTSPWLKDHPAFRASLVHLTIRGSGFDRIEFAFPH